MAQGKEKWRVTLVKTSSEMYEYQEKNCFSTVKMRW